MNVLRTAILDWCRRSGGTSFLAGDVLRSMFPEDWELFVEDLVEELMQMHREGILVFYRDGVVLSPDDFIDAKVEIVCLRKPK